MNKLTENEQYHRSRNPELPPGYRFLWPWEKYEQGDEYNGNGREWWPANNVGKTPRETETFCYHPRRAIFIFR